MHRERVLELLRRSKSELQACFGVTGLALFGSTARDTATSTSDVDVLVAFDKAELSAQAAPRLDKLANFLKQFPDRKLLIEGYTDSVGGDRYNQDLSDRRAQAVRDALVQRGVDSSRISARGYGKAHPVADNASPEGRAMNRRVEIVIADDKGNLRGR